MFYKKWRKYILLILICLVLFFFKLAILGNEIKQGIVLTNTLDFSWNSDIVERFLHGHIAGKDFIFTYGPLYQILQSFPSLLFNMPSYFSILFFPILLSFINYIIIFFFFKLLVNKNDDFTLPFILILIITEFILPIDPNNLIRIMMIMLFSLAYYKLSLSSSPFSIRRVGMLILPAVMGTYVFDLYFYSLGIVLFLSIIETYHRIETTVKTSIIKATAQIFESLFFPVGLAIAYMLLTSFLISSDLRYIIYSIDTVNNYQFIMNIPFSINRAVGFFLAPVILMLTLIVGLKKKLILDTYKYELIFLSLVALFQAKSLLTRADEDHIFTGIYPSIIILFIILFIIAQKLKKIPILILIFIAIFAYKSGNYLNFNFLNINYSTNLVLENRNFFDIYRLPYNYYYTKKDFQYFYSLIESNPGNVMVYPYDTYILNINNQTFNTLPLQFYQYSNSLVEKESVEKLKQNPPKFIILGIDEHSSISLDNIPNLSRNPQIAKWMISNYSVYKNMKNYLILQHEKLKKEVETLSKDCDLYEIDFSKIMKTSLYENIFKSSTYYLNNDNDIRIPYAPNSSKLFLIDNYNNPLELSAIFERKINFKNFNISKKKLKIIKKHPIPKLQETYTDVFPVKCF